MRTYYSSTQVPLIDDHTLWSDDFLSAPRRELQQNGWLYLSGLAPDCQWITLALLLTSSRLMQQDKREYIRAIHSAPGYERLTNANSANFVPPHTDFPYLDLPPKYLVLWCLKSSYCKGGQTNLIDGKHLISEVFSKEELNQLKKPNYEFKSVDYHKKLIAPIIDLINDHTVLRFSYNMLKLGEHSPNLDAKPLNPNPFLEEMCDRVLKRADEFSVSIKMEDNSILIWSNWSMLHSRNPFEDQSRCLHRLALV